MRRYEQRAHAANLHAHQPLVPALDNTPGADHALERLAALPRGVEHGAILQGAGVLGGDQCTLDYAFTVAEADVGDLEFVVVHGDLLGCLKVGVFPELGGFGKFGKCQQPTAMSRTGSLSSRTYIRLPVNLCAMITIAICHHLQKF